MDLDSAFGESKPLRYFLVTQTFRHYPDDLAFTRSEQVTLMVSFPGHFFKGCSMLQPTALTDVPGARTLYDLFIDLALIKVRGTHRWFREAKAS